MIKITKPGPARVDIELSGTLDADAMTEGLDRLIAQSEDVRNGQMLYTIHDFSFPSIGALGVEFVRLPKLFGLLGKFDRCAVLCDAAWMRTIAEVEGALFPGLQIKSFEIKDRPAAERWLSQTTPLDSDPTENMPV